jgi:hypothetical protein
LGGVRERVTEEQTYELWSTPTYYVMGEVVPVLFCLYLAYRLPSRFEIDEEAAKLLPVRRTLSLLCPVYALLAA